MAEYLDVTLVGARDLRGRFASMTDYRLRDHLLERSRSLADEVQRIYRNLAPRSHEESDDHTHLADTIEGHAHATPIGFELNVGIASDDAKVAMLLNWIKRGTRPHPIVAHGRALSFFWERLGQQVRLHSVNHPGTRPNHWEEHARKEVEPLVEAEGNRIGKYVVDNLAGGL